MINIRKLETELWEAADLLRADSKVSSQEYCMPVLGLIFLRYAYSRFKFVEADILKDRPMRNGRVLPVESEDFKTKSAIFLPEKARYDYLLNLPDDEDMGQAINHAMELIEEQSAQLKGILPKTYTILKNDLLRELLRIFNNSAFNEMKDDVIGRIYEYFLNKFAPAVSSDDGVFFTPKSLVSGSTMTLGERSDGLRWYLNLFINVMANNLPSRQVIYLFDEPGISLHVNAQKELLKLFADMASKSNQIVYTTHSPYMLDTANNGIERIRATVKDESGITKIYRTAYHPNIAPDAQEDTLTPIIRALGMSISDTFGPAYEKFNVVTEGISDCVYLLCVGKKLGIDLSKYAFIPVVGASNLINVCTILHGWGCNYMALFDYDSEGVTKGGEIFKNKYELEYKKYYIYLRDASEEEITNKTYKTNEVEIETLVADLDDCLTNKGHAKCGKVLNAKWYADALEDGTHTCSSETLNNFKELFDRINSCICG